MVKYEDLPKFLTDCKVEMGEDDRGQKGDCELRIADLKTTGQIKKRKRQTRGRGEAARRRHCGFRI